MNDNTGKVVIISGMPFRTDTNLGKTLTSLFSDFQRNELAELYFNIKLPNETNCESYYQINEEQLIKSLFGLIRHKCGRVISWKEISPDTELVVTPSAIKGNKLIQLMRPLLWKMSFWFSSSLKNWIEAQHPVAVFCLLSPSIHINKVARYINKKYNCPVFLYVTDDYYHGVEKNSGFLSRLRTIAIQKNIEKTGRVTKEVIGISELAAREFGVLFGKPCATVLTPTTNNFLSLPYCSQHEKEVIVFRYFGNIALERWKTLRLLGEAIARYNQGGTKAILEIYTIEQNERMLREISVPNGSKCMGFISGNRYYELLQSADVVVHAESFSREIIKATRLAMSTKIADYLGAGKCILAIGPGEIASMEHLSSAAFLVNDINYIDATVKMIIENPEIRSELQQKARAVAFRDHNPDEIGKKLRAIICFG